MCPYFLTNKLFILEIILFYFLFFHLIEWLVYNFVLFEGACESTKVSLSMLP
jgi:hypothetical protein